MSTHNMFPLKHHYPRRSALRKTTGGFTLIETLVAIATLLLAISGPLTAASSAITQALYAKDQVVAIALAQEAIEGVRNVRDTNALENVPGNWLNNPSGGGPLTNCNNDCGIEISHTTSPSAVAVKKCNSFAPKDCVLNYNTALGWYNHEAISGTNQQTRFTRTIAVSPIGGNEVSVTATVTWKTSSLYTERSFTVHENLLNWQQASAAPLPQSVVFASPKRGSPEEILCSSRGFDSTSRAQFCSEEGYSSVDSFFEESVSGRCSYFDGSAWQIDNSHSVRLTSLTCINP